MDQSVLIYQILDKSVPSVLDFRSLVPEVLDQYLGFWETAHQPLP